MYNVSVINEKNTLVNKKWSKKTKLQQNVCDRICNVYLLEKFLKIS